MGKRLTRIILLCCALAAMLAVSAAAEETDNTRIPYPVEGGNLYFNAETGEIVECDWGVTKADIPSEINGISVTGIARSAFSRITTLETVKIPDSVTNIGDYVFAGCYGLLSIDVDAGNANYISINGVLFNKDKSVLIAYPIGNEQTAYTIPDGVTEIAVESFYECRLADVIMPDSLTVIRSFAFAYSDLTKVTFPKNLEEIEGAAFSWCDHLESIEVASQNQNYSSLNGVLFNKDGTNLIRFPSGRSGRYEIPNGVVTIEGFAFEGSESLENVIIPDSVNIIEGGAFFECFSLTDITIPANVSEIGIQAFRDCDSLTKIDVDAGNSYYKSVDGVLFDKEGTRLIAYPIGSERTVYQIPDGVEIVEEDAFFHSSALTQIIMPDTLENLKNRSFCQCQTLSNIIIPGNVTSIGNSAFFNCNSVTEITMPDSVAFIGRSAFERCQSLTDVYYGGSESQWNAIENIAESYLISDTITIHYGKTDSDALVPGSTRVIPASRNYTANLDYFGENLTAGTEYQIIYAIYDNDGTMLSVRFGSVTFDDTFRTSLAVQDVQTDTRCRIFLLNDIYAPMSAAAQLNFTTPAA